MASKNNNKEDQNSQQNKGDKQDRNKTQMNRKWT